VKLHLCLQHSVAALGFCYALEDKLLTSSDPTTVDLVLHILKNASNYQGYGRIVFFIVATSSAVAALASIKLCEKYY